MKFYSFTLFAAFAVFALGACGKKAQAEPQPKKDSVAVAHDTVVEKPKVPSLTFQRFSKKQNTKHSSIDVEFVLAYSKDYPNLAYVINEWVNEQLGGEFQGKLDDGNAMLRFYFKPSKDNDEDSFTSEYSVKISKVYETSEFISLEVESYSYLGGAHGSPSFYGATFRKIDGRRFDSSMIIRNRLFNKYLIAGLIKAFEVKNKEELNDALECSELGDFDDVDTRLLSLPLPTSDPWFTKDGLKFVYQPYEIGAFSVGMPTVCIPFSKLKPMLKASGKTYLK